MELRQLRYAVAVADAGHFGRAAEELRIAQSGLSQQIKALERLLGTALFVRSTRQVSLTPTGRAFIERARELLELADRAKQTVSLVERGKTGLLKVATNGAGLSLATGELLTRYARRYPKVEVELHPGFSPQNLEALRARRVDVAEVTLPFGPAEPLNYLRLGWIEVLAIIPDVHRLASVDRISRDDLLHQPFLTLPRSVNPPVIDFVHAELFEGHEPPSLIEAIDMAPPARMSRVAEDGELIAIGFGSEALLERSGVVFRSFEEPVPGLEHGIAWLDANVSPFVDSFVDVARELTEQAAHDSGDPSSALSRAGS